MGRKRLIIVDWVDHSHDLNHPYHGAWYRIGSSTVPCPYSNQTERRPHQYVQSTFLIEPGFLWVKESSINASHYETLPEHEQLPEQLP